MSDLATVVYTNKNNLPIVKLFLQQFMKHTSTRFHEQSKLYVVLNEIPDNVVDLGSTVEIINANVPFEGNGGHFSKTVEYALHHITEPYIFWFCDDYLLTDDIDEQRLDLLLTILKREPIDMFTFASIVQHSGYKSTTFNEFDGETFYHVDDDYLHKFSVQPCIWKRTSLLDVVQNNTITLHDLDCSRIMNKEKYNVVCTPYRIYDVCPTCPQKFIIQYIEIIRHGVFQLEENGQAYLPPYQEFLTNFILDNELHINESYRKYFGFDPTTLTRR